MFKLGGVSSWSTSFTGWSTFLGKLTEIVEPCSNMQMRFSLELHEAPDLGAHYVDAGWSRCAAAREIRRMLPSGAIDASPLACGLVRVALSMGRRAAAQAIQRDIGAMGL